METKIRALIKEAMIEKNKTKLITYKNILECAQKTAKETNASVTDEMITKAIKNEIKQLNDFLEYCPEDSERFKETLEKVDYCEAVLPKMATEEEIMNYLVKNNVEKNIGLCMKALKQNFGANMDGKMASGVVRKYISL